MIRPEVEALHRALAEQLALGFLGHEGVLCPMDDGALYVRGCIRLAPLVDAVLAAVEAKAARLERYIVAANHPNTTLLPRDQYWAIIDEKNAALAALQHGDIPVDVRARLF